MPTTEAEGSLAEADQFDLKSIANGDANAAAMNPRRRKNPIGIARALIA
jgi:hypothetical protein